MKKLWILKKFKKKVSGIRNMGLLKMLFGKKYKSFKPDFSKTEYDDWLDYLDNGGTTEQWELLKTECSWQFKQDESEIFSKKRESIKPFEDKYYSLMEQIQNNWSKLYKSKDYHGELAKNMEKDCLQDIQYYEELRNEEKKYETPDVRSVPAFTRLAMLYEKQGRYEECINICKKAIGFGVDERNRMNRMIKKVGREANDEEMKLLGDLPITRHDKEVTKPINEINVNHIDRRKIPAQKIDEMQRIMASASYCQKIYNKYYKNYPEMPFISRDRELNTNWIEQAEIFPKQNIISKSMMTRFRDGLLPGHVYMLYWIKEINRKRIPSYFEYKYGINFTKEQQFLQKQGYLSESMNLTSKGQCAIDQHHNIIENHK